mgnify:CR=1 FL=1
MIQRRLTKLEQAHAAATGEKPAPLKALVAMERIDRPGLFDVEGQLMTEAEFTAIPGVVKLLLRLCDCCPVQVAQAAPMEPSGL